LSDNIEKHRKIALSMIKKIIQNLPLKDEYNLILPKLIDRTNSFPYKEQSEEIRIELIKIYTEIFNSHNNAFLPFISDFCEIMLSKLLKDPCPDVNGE
jgi:hypothetical protein